MTSTTPSTSLWVITLPSGSLHYESEAAKASRNLIGDSHRADRAAVLASGGPGMQGHVMRISFDPFAQQPRSDFFAKFFTIEQHIIDVPIMPRSVGYYWAAQQPGAFRVCQSLMIVVPQISLTAVISSAASSCASSTAATRSLGRYDEPILSHSYLSISPRRKAVRLVPFSRRIWARSTNAGSLIRRRPPSPEITFLL
jgi:hypothetical protein